MVKVIASGVRKGNVLELEDGKLYLVLKAESFFPGKGTPTTQVEMRRISDGIKTVQRYKTTDQVERAFVEELTHTYLYQDGESFVFMNPETFEQLSVTEEVVGDYAPYLTEGMECSLQTFNGVAIAITIPTRVTLEVTETEPVIKGQTAAGSYKPAVLSNGVRTAVPHHIDVGSKIVVSTEDGSYVERAKG